MQTIKLSVENARKMYPTACAEIKTMLEDSFGKESLKLKVTERIKTWEDAANEMGIDPVTSPPFPIPVGSFENAANAFFKLDVIATVLLEGVVLDWTNSDQRKYYAWFNNYKPGSCFSFGGSGCGWTAANSRGGARLCVDTAEKAEYFGRQFIDIFNQFLNPNK